MDKNKTPLQIAMDAFGGSQKDLAQLVGLTPQRISAIKKHGGNLPRTKMKEFSRATGLSVQTLYPDAF